MSSLLSRICQLSKAVIGLLRPSKEHLTFIFFLALSGAIWLITACNEYNDSEIEVPVLITGVPKNVALDSGQADTIKVTIHDKIFSLLYYRYLTGVLPMAEVEIDFASYSRNGKIVVSNTELKKLVTNTLKGTASIVALKPDKLEYGYSQSVTKSVPVVLTGSIEAEENYYILSSKSNPDRITIYLSKSMSDSIKYVETVPLSISHVVDSTSVEVALRPIRGVNFSVSKVKVTATADILTEDEVELPVQAVNVPEGVALRLFPSRVKVKYVVGTSLYDQINTKEFSVEADYKAIIPGTDKCPIAIVARPHGVVRAELEVSQVDYLMEY